MSGRISPVGASIAILLCGLASPASAYVQSVHVQMTRRAFSRLNVDFRSKIGVQSTQTLGGNIPRVWMEQGAHAEDYLLPSPRPLNHFFQPVYLEGLSVPASLCTQVGIRADRWAIEPTLLTGNDYSIGEARRHYRNTVLGATADERENSAGLLFKSLGHVVHLIQDMAQPEHTRNDQHLPGTQKLLGNGTDASVWEEWGKVNLSDANTSLIDFDGYPTVRLPDYASYFHTSHTLAGRLAGKGMADFSNLNFVTQDTNYHDENPNWQCSPDDSPAAKCLYHTEPKIEEAARRVLQDQLEVIMVYGEQEIAIVDEEVYTSFPRDHYLGTQETDIFHTYVSSIDLETREYGCLPLYSLGDASYLSRAAMLVPRAVGYSAGIVEHFFRGKIDVEWKQTSPGVYDMTIVNQSTEPLGADARVEARYRATPQYFEGKVLDGDTAPIVSAPIATLVPGFAGLQPGQRVTIPGIAPAYLKEGNAITNFERRIVIEGTLGIEPAAVIGVVQKAAPGIIAVTADCWSGGDCAFRTFSFNPETGFMDYGKKLTDNWEEKYLAFGGFTQSCSFDDPLPAGTKILKIEAWLPMMEQSGAPADWSIALNGTPLGKVAMSSQAFDCGLPTAAFFAVRLVSDAPSFYKPGEQNVVTVSGALWYDLPTYANWYAFNKARVESVIFLITYE